MKDVSFYDIIISKEDLKIVSADARVYDAFGEYSIKSMVELVAPEDRDIFLSNVKICDGSWYPGKLVAPDKLYYTYMKATEENESLIRVTVVNAEDLLTSHNSLMRTINLFQAQLDMYEDVFFVYDPNHDAINVFNTEISDFETKVYTIDEFERVLLKRAPDDQLQQVKAFITQVKSRVGRSSVIIEGNLLNDDPSVSHTVLDEAFVFYDKDSDGVVGHIQLRRTKGSVTSTSIQHDSLTGLVDKTDILRIARERVDEKKLEGTTFVIIDIDYFKTINDTYGHKFGDEVVKKVADIISNEVGIEGLSGRFGGDEFFVLLYNITSEKQLRSKLKAIKNMVCSTFPNKGIDKDNPLSVSIGAAVYPKDADNYDDLFTLADHCLYIAKEKGRNRYVFYTPNKHGTIESIKQQHQTIRKISGRDMSYGDVIVKMFNMALHSEDCDIEQYMNEFAEAFDLQNVMLFVGEPFVHRYSAGIDAVDDKVAVDFVLGILNSPERNNYFALGDFVVINRLEMLPPHAHKIREFLKKRGTFSLIFIRFYDKEDRECVLIISSVGKMTLWNQTHFKYYRAFVDLLSLHSLR